MLKLIGLAKEELGVVVVEGGDVLKHHLATGDQTSLQESVQEAAEDLGLEWIGICVFSWSLNLYNFRP